jgi:light-independent protochlorophyllide reductase subunit L
VPEDYADRDLFALLSDFYLNPAPVNVPDPALDLMMV